MGCQTQTPPRANGPSTESFINYDQSSSPDKKIQPQGIPVSYTQIGLKLHSWRKKSFLTTKPALVIQMDIVCVDGRFNMLGCI